MAFTQKLISASFSMSTGVFSDGGNTATVNNLRTHCKIVDYGGAAQALLDMTIYGLPLNVMNQLSTVGAQISQIAKNSITVQTGDENGMSNVFMGNILNGFVDAQKMPEVGFHIIGRPGQYSAVQPAQPISQSGPVNAVSLLQQLAGQMGLNFVNQGVPAIMLSNPYYPGNATTQVDAIASHAGINYSTSLGNLTIFKSGQGSPGTPISVAKDSIPPMVGYPAFNSAKIIVTTGFNPKLIRNATIQVQSDLTPACGQWSVTSIEHDLDSMTPHGRWFSIVEATPIGQENVQ